METINSQRTDEELVELLSNGHEGAFAEVYRRHGGPVFGLAKRLIRDTDLAQEIVQEVMLRLWKQPGEVRRRPRVAPLVFAVTHTRSECRPHPLGVRAPYTRRA